MVEELVSRICQNWENCGQFGQESTFATVMDSESQSDAEIARRKASGCVEGIAFRDIHILFL